MPLGKDGLTAAPSVHVVRERIAALRRLSLEKADVDFLKRQLFLLFKGYSLSTPVVMAGQILFRGVKWIDRPSNHSHLTYPPANLVRTFQRANRPGHPMFYCSVAREAPFFELGSRAGDYLAISRWRVNEKLIVNNAGYIDEVLRRVNSDRNAPPSWEKQDPSHDRPANRLIHGFLAQEFARDVPVGAEHVYKLSVAITEKLLGDLPLGTKDEDILCISGFAGIIYPALAMRANTDNLALLPEFVDRFLQLEQVEYIRIDSASDDLKYQVTKLDFANTFGPDGEIEWKGRLPQWRVPPGSTVRVSVEGGKYVVRDEKGNTIEPT